MSKMIRIRPLLLLFLIGVMFTAPLPSLATGEKDTATITVDINASLGKVNRDIFGHNILVTNGLWNTSTNSIDPGALPLLREISPGILRFPGGSVSDIYAWEDGVGVRTSSPAGQSEISITLDEAPNWKGIKKARILDKVSGKHGVTFTFLSLDGNRFEGLWGLSAYHPPGATVRPEPRVGQPGWLANSYGILEHMETARSLGTPVLITVNYGTGLDRDGAISTSASLSQKTKRAAAFVAFCNGDPSDGRTLGSDTEGNDWKTIGYWAGKRKSRGYPEPFGVVYWEVGNEVFLQGEVGFTNVKKYAQDFILFSKAMKSVDSRIKVGAVGHGSPQGLGDADRSDKWNGTLLGIAHKEMDFLAIHPYYPSATRKQADYAGREWFTAVMAGADQAMEDLREIRRIMNTSSPTGSSIAMAITEYGIWPADSKEGYDFSNIARVVFDMDLLAGLLREQAALGVNLANAWNLHGSNPTALIRFDWSTGSRLLRPQYHAYRMAANSLQPLLVGTRVSCPTFSTVRVGNMFPKKDVPIINAVATASEDRKVLAVMVINRSLSGPASCSIRTPGFSPQAVKVTTLSGPAPGAGNETNSGTVVPESTQREGIPRVFSLPPHSVSLIELRTEARPAE